MPWSGINAKCCRLSRPELQTGRQKYLNMVLFYAWYIYGHSMDFKKRDVTALCVVILPIWREQVLGEGVTCKTFVCMRCGVQNVCLLCLTSEQMWDFFKYCAASSSMRLNSVTTETDTDRSSIAANLSESLNSAGKTPWQRVLLHL